MKTKTNKPKVVSLTELIETSVEIGWVNGFMTAWFGQFPLPDGKKDTKLPKIADTLGKQLKKEATKYVSGNYQIKI